MTTSIIQLENITKKYNDFTAVDSLNLDIKKGEIFGLLGPNGAGKSTSILMMLGLTEPTAGQVEVCGINATQNPIEVKKQVGYLPEDVGFYDNWTALENLIYTAQLNGIDREEAKSRAEKLLERVGLGEETTKKVGKFSKGMRQRLGLADVLIKQPEVIILDEPTSGIDPRGVQDFLNLIVELRNEHGISVLFSSHNLHQVQQVCDRVGIFVDGKLLAEGNIESLSKQLFTHGMYLIEVGAKNAENKPLTLPEIEELLNMSEIESIKEDENRFQIMCSTDISDRIAKNLVENGIKISFLNKKEYGLDAIYNRYFEGGLKNE